MCGQLVLSIHCDYIQACCLLYCQNVFWNLTQKKPTYVFNYSSCQESTFQNWDFPGVQFQPSSLHNHPCVHCRQCHATHFIKHSFFLWRIHDLTMLYNSVKLAKQNGVIQKFFEYSYSVKSLSIINIRCIRWC